MGEYQRFVSYLYEYQKDRKEKNAGFVRVNMRGGQTKLCVGLKVLEGEGQALLLGVGKRPLLLGSVRHKAGDGGETFLMRSSDVRGSGAPFSDFSGLRVETPAGSVYKTFWDDRMVSVKEAVRQEAPRPQLGMAEITEGAANQKTPRPQLGRANIAIEEEQAKAAKPQPDMAEIAMEAAHAKEMGPQPDMAEIIETVETKKAEPITENAMGQENLGDPADSGNGIRLSEIVPEAMDSAEPEFGTQMSEAVSDAIAPAATEFVTPERETEPNEIERREPDAVASPESDVYERRETDAVASPATVYGTQKSEAVSDSIASAVPKFGIQKSEAVSDSIASAVPKFGTQESDTAPDAMAPAASVFGIRVSEAVSNGESRQEGWKKTEEDSFVVEAGQEELTASVEAQCWPREGDWQEPEICWSQLERIYPKILPYGVGDHWEMLRIRLQDIGRLPRECWDYGKNAFVIQGYQEYHYLVLIRDTKRNKCYLGVPGEDTMADPMVAAGFGFRDFRRGRQHGYWISGIRLGGENT